MRTRIRYVHAINAELAVAQELEVLKADGCHVFHDLQTDKFNLDHVVVGPGGVYCIETKSRLKPDTDNRKQDAQVQYDGKKLKFPDWIETKPIEQALWQTKWLKNYINKSTGESYAVTPVLALPGWFVKQQGRFDLRVVNSKNPLWMLNGSNCQSLDSAQTQRIAFQLEKLARIEA
ncbi:MAG: nuclease-related domain-containing protein [Gammaproteobacteria bacterium]